MEVAMYVKKTKECAILFILFYEFKLHLDLHYKRNQIYKIKVTVQEAILKYSEDDAK